MSNNTNTSHTGMVISGINNIYLVRPVKSGEVIKQDILCRIKGKILKELETVYNPIAVGDRVRFVLDTHSPNQGLITERLPRKNSFTRLNRKRNAVQTVAANIDLLVCVSSADEPPFRPRFIDRVLVSAGNGMDALIVLNKTDYGVSEDIHARLASYEEIGYPYILCSVKTGDGIQPVKDAVTGKLTAFVGQSGVGKSSLINALYPEAGLKTGEISVKYNRGRHTTNSAVLTGYGDEWYIDTPGIREIEIADIDSDELTHRFPEFSGPSRGCAFSPCRHSHEPDCGVKRAVRDGHIHPDRYESYLRILIDLEARGKKFTRGK